MEWRSEVHRGIDRLSAELAIALGGGSSAPPLLVLGEGRSGWD